MFNNIQKTLHYSVHMRTSGGKVRISDDVFNRFHFIVITGFISSYKIIVGVIYIILLSVMLIE